MQNLPEPGISFWYPVGFNELEIISGCWLSSSACKVKWNSIIYNTHLNVRWRSHRVRINLHKVNTWETCDSWFPHSWGKRNRVWQSWALVIMMLEVITRWSYAATEPVTQQPPLPFLQMMIKLKCLSYLRKALYPPVHRQWEELTKCNSDHRAVLLQQARGFLGHFTPDNASFFSEHKELVNFVIPER